MSEERQLITIEESNLPALFSENGCDPLLNRIKDELAGHDPDVSTAKGRKEIASLAYKVRQSKTVIDAAGKEFVSKIKKQAKVIDIERKRVRDQLDSWAETVRSPLTQWEEEEKERIAAIALEAEILQAHEQAIEQNVLFNRQRELEKKEAELARREEERLEEEREEQRLAEEKEREERIRKEAEESAAKKAAQEIERERERAILAEQRLADEREREDRRREEAVLRERERIEKEAFEAEQKEKRRAADIAHQRKVNNRIVAEFVAAGVDEEVAKTVIVLVAKSKISGMSINY